MEALYEAIGNRLKHVFKGYTAWILGYRQEHFDKIGLKPSAKIPTLNGALECEFRKYEIFEGTYAAHKRATATEPPKPRPMRSKDKPRKEDKKPFARGDKKPFARDEKKPLRNTDGKPFEKRERKPIGDKERKPFARRDDKKPATRGEKGRFEKRERPTTPRTTENSEARMPKKTTAGSRTRTRKTNNENK